MVSELANYLKRIEDCVRSTLDASRRNRDLNGPEGTVSALSKKSVDMIVSKLKNLDTILNDVGKPDLYIDLRCFNTMECHTGRSSMICVAPYCQVWLMRNTWTH